MSRPGIAYAQAATALVAELDPPFRKGRGGPGGWVVLYEPELHFGQDILVPDVAAWRRERMPELPHQPYLTLVPDWVCEILSPSTQAYDRVKKLRVYQQQKVPYVWLIEPIGQILEVLRLDGDAYRIIAAHGGDERVRAEPFEAVEMNLAVLWER